MQRLGGENELSFPRNSHLLDDFPWASYHTSLGLVFLIPGNDNNTFFIGPGRWQAPRKCLLHKWHWFYSLYISPMNHSGPCLTGPSGQFFIPRVMSPFDQLKKERKEKSQLHALEGLTQSSCPGAKSSSARVPGCASLSLVWRLLPEYLLS